MNWPQVITHVCFPRRDRHYAEQVSGRIAESVVWKAPPVPVRPGDFWSVGKTTDHAWPHRWLYQTDNSDSSLSIMALPGSAAFPTIPSAMVQRVPTFAPHHGQNPVKESIALKTPQPGHWGASRELAPLIGIGPQYMKLI